MFILNKNFSSNLDNGDFGRKRRLLFEYLPFFALASPINLFLYLVKQNLRYFFPILVFMDTKKSGKLRKNKKDANLVRRHSVKERQKGCAPFPETWVHACQYLMAKDRCPLTSIHWSEPNG